ncbi:fused MFS/spermidine synthase [Steroidobacter sp. S1-65]|uniref:Fused MFS/spermidine synthase n=1 Tax=Steroidobacter gossypii TaxID=2805490 RepID=A0ABS1WXG4_9GAMM|nr:fused MFS/spermidine synthase [Steroidobacter gossypii]MBM0105670.1 fused MFS/spermidine synthase [Steroidobacter gossypii]
MSAPSLDPQPVTAESWSVTQPRWTPLYAVTVIVGACLLFLVQPLIAKIILPWFGGTSSVWSAALVFFQACVLAGYSYAHWLTTRISPRRQSLIHVALLLGSCLMMPILPADALRPDATDDPTWQILLLLTVTVGLPSIVLSSTSPLLQVWYMRRTGSEPPYWLFALSNAGSLLALLSFPLALEPAFTSHALAIGWSAVFVVFAVLCAGAAYLNSKQTRSDAEQSMTATAEQGAAAPSVGHMALWLLLSACASGLLVAVSANLSANVAPIPLLWVVPLALYLLTFILAFGHHRVYHPTWFFPLVALSLGCLAYLYTQRIENHPIQYVIPLYLASLFVLCMACHGELVLRRPAGPYLTRFYLLISLGGVLGGAFVGLIAPAVFTTYIELPVLLVVIAELYVLLQWHRRGSRRTLWLVRATMIAGVITLFIHLTLSEIQTRRESELVQRNFYGVLSVQDDPPLSELARRYLIHGTISHGYQYLNTKHRFTPASYFSRQSGVGLAITALQSEKPVRMGVVGLGVGVLSGYVRPADYMRLYEINPDVVSIAESHFSFLPVARQTGADVDVLLGDARLTLERQAPQQFDLLAIDAFSSDAIPTHLLTKEAFDLYFKHLKPDGVLAVHISNRFVDLAPVCARSAEHVNRTARVVHSMSDGTYDTSVWVIVTSNDALLARPEFQNRNTYEAVADQSFAGWTDQYSSIWPLLNIGGSAKAQ